MDVTIVIPLFNQWHLTEDCLDALSKNTDPSYELILVDNGSTDRTRDFADGDIVIRNQSNRGFSIACNQGATLASGEIVVFLNNDTIPQPGWLPALTAPFDDDQLGITGAKLLYPDGRIQHAGVELLTENGILTAKNVKTDEPSRKVQAVTGACMAARADLFADLGGFDPAFRNGYEDVDLCLRAPDRVWFAAESEVVHLESAGTYVPERWQFLRENIALLQERWA